MSRHMIYNFKDNRIRVISDEEGKVDKLCLNDICKVVNRQSMVEDGKAQKICKSSVQMHVRKNWPLVWYISTYDIHPLMKRIRCENRIVAKVCDELETWVVNLPTLNQLPSDNLTIQEKLVPVVFKYNGYPITYKVEGNSVLINVTELTRCFNKTPKDYLQLVSTARFRQSLVDIGEFADLDSQIFSSRGTHGGTWFHQQLAEHMANWLNPDHELSEWIEEKIDELNQKGYIEKKTVNIPINQHQKETTKSNDINFMDYKKKANKQNLSVSEKSSHILNEIIPANYPIPKTYSEALQFASQLMSKVEQQGQIIIENQHKVDFYVNFIEEREWFKTSSIADELRLSVVQLNRFLLEQKLIHYDTKIKQYSVFPQYKYLQCDVPYEWTNKFGKTYKYGYSKRWTHAGREFILELWHKENPGQKLLI